MPRIRTDDVAGRIYTRERGGTVRYYGDFRDFKALGGKQEALCPPGSSRATTDLTVARRLVGARLKELQRRQKNSLPTTTHLTFDDLVVHHLEKKAVVEGRTVQWLGNVQVHLEAAAAFFGHERALVSITREDIGNYVLHLCKLPNGRGGVMSAQSVTHYLNSLSDLMEEAILKGEIQSNPVTGAKRPRINKTLTPWLEQDESVTILRYAFCEWQPSRADLAIPHLPYLLALYFYTGLRETEATGLLISDINFDRSTIRVEQNMFRRLKTPTSERVVPFFPHLRELLSEYLNSETRPRGPLLFPSLEGPDRMITDIRKFLDQMPMPERLIRPVTPKEHAAEEKRRASAIARLEGRRRGPKPTESLQELLEPIPSTVVCSLRTKMIRHTYCTARLQTLDRGEPIAPFTVARELGHRDTKMIDKVYAHLGNFRARGEHVDFRW